MNHVSSLYILFSVGLVLGAPLDDYVARPEPDYGYEQIENPNTSDGTWPGEGCTFHVLNFTSLKWMDESFVNHTVWWHYLTIAMPDVRNFHREAFYHIGGGNNEDDPPPTPETDSYLNTLCEIASRTGAVSAYLKMIPNQPLYLNVTDPEDGRIEDAIIAYTWRVFIESEVQPEPEINLLFPMTKAAKLGMDATAEYVKTIEPSVNLDRYMPSGSSKRGWVTWLLGCVDPRVFAIAPRVFDLLNFHENIRHHYRAYGGWSWAFILYYAESVSKYLNHPRTQIIGSHIDPFEFNDRLTMPKLMMVSSSDEFFLPDGSHYFWDALTEPKYMLLLANEDHFQGNSSRKITDNIVNFFLSVLDTQYTFPVFTWARNETDSDGTITMFADPPPTSIMSWYADNTNWTHTRRDFRITINELSIDEPEGTEIPLPGPNPGMEWFEGPVEDLGGGQYRVTYPKRDGDYEWRGFFAEATFDSTVPGQTFSFSTEVNIIPDAFSFPHCQTESECMGKMK